MKEETTLERLYEFAQKHRNEEHAAWVILSFCAGECIHYGDENATECELCGYRPNG